MVETAPRRPDPVVTDAHAGFGAAATDGRLVAHHPVLAALVAFMSAGCTDAILTNEGGLS